MKRVINVFFVLLAIVFIESWSECQYQYPLPANGGELSGYFDVFRATKACGI